MVRTAWRKPCNGMRGLGPSCKQHQEDKIRTHTQTLSYTCKGNKNRETQQTHSHYPQSTEFISMQGKTSPCSRKHNRHPPCKKYKRVKVVDNKGEEKQHATLIKSDPVLSGETEKAHVKQHLCLCGCELKHLGG